MDNFESTPARADRMSIFICIMLMRWHQQIRTYSQLTRQKGCTLFLMQGMRLNRKGLHSI